MRVIKIKNLQESPDIYCGQEILPNEFYTVQDENERALFSKDDKTIAHLLSEPPKLVLNDGNNDITTNIINFLQSQSELLTYKITSIVPIVNNAPNYTLINGMISVPTKGIYNISFNGNVSFSSANKTFYIAVFYGDDIIIDSERVANSNKANDMVILSTLTDIEVDGIKPVEVRIKCEAGGILTVNNRTLFLLRRGD